jgi:hypothetical protein
VRAVRTHPGRPAGGPARQAGFAQASGRTLTINGYQVTIDSRALCHDLASILLGNQVTLPRPQTHQLTLIPAKSYLL